MISKILKLKIPGIRLLQHPLFSGSFLMFGGSMAINAINYLYHLVMGRILGPSSYGVLASLFSLLYIVSIVPLSTSVSIVKFISSAKNEGELSSVYYGIKNYVFKFSAVLLVIYILIAFPLANFLKIQDNISVIMVGPIMFFSIITLVNQSTSQGLLKFIGFVVPNLISSLVKLGVGVLLVLIGYSVGGAIFGVLSGAIFAYLVSSLAISNVVKNVKNAKFDVNKFVNYSLPVLLQAFAFTALFSVDVLLAKHFLSEFEAGIYASLSTLGKVIYFATSPISSVMFPIISKRFSSGERYNKIFFTSLSLTLGVSHAIVFVYWRFPNLVINTLFGSNFFSGSENLVFMGVFMVFYSTSNLLMNFYLSRGKTWVVVFPVIASFAQLIFIYFFYHSSITEIIKVSMYITICLTIALFALINYEKKDN